MSKGKKEITEIIERFELREEMLGVVISGLYANCEYITDDSHPYYTIRINFDIASLSGNKLGRSVSINASAYNSAGQLLGAERTQLFDQNFMGFSSESICFYSLDQEPKKIRLYPS